ncbi:phospholipase D-like domain-containing protein [Mucilaginibacter pedocola]|uniref:phospholipase D-like domain-containing protein n=1 Tax=Mucilaginibacter pedocola TaxID=1792845 RepID=UPI00192E5479|nr:phospholipase D-like domain-containing protein [Mucilaginibacter pedocola]
MKGIKRFKNKDVGLAPGTPVNTSDHPIQSFQWCDYTAKANHHYSFRIVPAYGTVKFMKLDDENSLEIAINTELEMEAEGNSIDNKKGHDIFFNRGVIGSQAYAREFGNAPPDENEPFSKEMVWLSRGLFEALTGFIALAKSEEYSLRAALYEFHYLPVAVAFAKSAEAGADVKIVYDAESSYKVSSLETIEAAGLDKIKAVIKRTVSEGIRHNKFIVLLHKDEPVAVWTGSTNISAGGIFGQSNVGHIVWDSDIARSYLKYWKHLSENIPSRKIRALNQADSPIPKGLPDRNSIFPVFSARDEDDDNTTLQWYADLMDSAKKLMCITFAFNIDEVFQKVIQKQNDVLRYIVKDDDLGKNEIIGQDNDVLFAAGGHFGKKSLFNFREERDNPLNVNDYIHNKFMLIDPLSEDPIVVTGSANFSRPSQRINDENMLVIRGDTRVADIYFGEFMRIFDHHYARYIFKKLTENNKNNPDAGYLKPDNSWIASHFNRQSYKSKRREYFISG